MTRRAIRMQPRSTHQFRAALEPRLYRDIEIASDASLHDLAAAIVGAFGFDLDHPFGFYSRMRGSYLHSPVKYESWADLPDIESDAGSVLATGIVEVFPRPGAKMLFLFDYGDQWMFAVTLRAIDKPDAAATYPRVVGSEGKAPPQYPTYDEP